MKIISKLLYVCTTFGLYYISQESYGQVLTTNIDFSNPSGTSYTDNTGSNTTALPGWVAVFDNSAAQYASYYGNSNNQSGVSGYFGYITDVTLQTDSTDRGNVTAGFNYNVTFQLRNDYYSTTGGTVNVLWYASNNTTLLGSSSSGLLLSGSTSYNSTDPLQSFSFSVVAPTGATFAGIQWNSSGSQIGSNFQITSTSPEPTTICLIGIGMIFLAALRHLKLLSK